MPVARANRTEIRIIRVIKCLRLLERACYSVSDLAKRFGVCRRTVYRDLRLLTAAGVPLMRRTSDRGLTVVDGPPPPT